MRCGMWNVTYEVLGVGCGQGFERAGGWLLTHRSTPCTAATRALSVSPAARERDRPTVEAVDGRVVFAAASGASAAAPFAAIPPAAPLDLFFLATFFVCFHGRRPTAPADLGLALVDPPAPPRLHRPLWPVGSLTSLATPSCSIRSSFAASTKLIAESGSTDSTDGTAPACV